MAEQKIKEKEVLRALGDGLILRRARPEDAEALGAFNAQVHSEEGWEQPEEKYAHWTVDLLTKPHPTLEVGDVTVVEDTGTGKLVSSLNLIPQSWSYAGIDIPVGRPEMVGTHPAYRQRGLVRAQMEVVHAWSEGRGQLLQAITGIPWYYRMFGYEMVLELGGGKMGHAADFPVLKEGQEEPYVVRKAKEKDLAFIEEVYAQGMVRYLVSCQRDEALWRYELDGRAKCSAVYRQLNVIESGSGERVGFLAHPRMLWGSNLSVTAYEVQAGQSWLDVTGSVLRYLKATGEGYTEKEAKQPFKTVRFSLGSQHPVYEVISQWLPKEQPPYAWYLRVPDLPAFLRNIAPALEVRLADSALAGHSGELRLSFYREGLRLTFEKGQVKAVEAWKPTRAVDLGEAGEGMAFFPDLSFLQLLFGYRTIEELEYAFADCYVQDSKYAEARLLLKALFPAQASYVWPVA